MDVQHPGKKIVILEVPTKDDEYGIDWRKNLLINLFIDLVCPQSI